MLEYKDEYDNHMGETDAYTDHFSIMWPAIRWRGTHWGAMGVCAGPFPCGDEKEMVLKLNNAGCKGLTSMEMGGVG